MELLIHVGIKINYFSKMNHRTKTSTKLHAVLLLISKCWFRKWLGAYYLPLIYSPDHRRLYETPNSQRVKIFHSRRKMFDSKSVIKMTRYTFLDAYVVQSWVKMDVAYMGFHGTQYYLNGAVLFPGLSLITYSATSQYLNKYWHIVAWTLLETSKISWIKKQTSTFKILP